MFYTSTSPMIIQSSHLESCTLIAAYCYVFGKETMAIITLKAWLGHGRRRTLINGQATESSCHWSIANAPLRPKNIFPCGWESCCWTASGLELLISVGSLVLSGGKAEITEVSKCSGDEWTPPINHVTILSCLGTSYVLFWLLSTLRVLVSLSGEWIIREEKKMIKGHVDIPEFSFGELDDLQLNLGTKKVLNIVPW
ncbi:hypothetical protein CK203_038215 [Vitis vinifera]|uniref:Uncharacterized protein n=1 Tax=Vitis vinifera TaxID=29760 RepID=A0A438IBL6_VITVI|nr:hypothetical protein CK203_038215 [Vitis vinifera]